MAGGVPEEGQSVGSRIEWGSVGESHWDRISPREGQLLDESRGVARTAEPLVTYCVPPPGSLRIWRRIDGDKYEMDLGVDDLPPYETLYDLSVRLTKRAVTQGGIFAQDDSDLKKLDRVADQLLRIAGRLHAARYSVGLLHPRNILILQSPEGEELILPDVGFVWRPGGPMLPNWLVRNSPFRDLWDHTAETMNSQLQEAHGKFSPQSDLHTLARVFAWALRARPAMEGLPRYAREPKMLPTFAEDPQTRALVWALLTEVLGDEIQSAEELRTELAKTPLSAHFIEKPASEELPSTPWRRRAAVGGAAVLVLLLVGAVGYKIWIDRTLPLASPPGCEDCPGETKLREELVELSQAVESWDALTAKRKAGLADSAEIAAQLQAELGELDRQVKRLTALHQIQLHPNKHFRAKEDACLAKLRGEFEERLTSAVNNLRADLRAVGYRGREACPLLADLDRQLKEYCALSPTQEPPSCSTKLKALAERFGCR
ncbi:MAG: hypothetical protein NTY19_26005 [Planctomycetota bacterium]|nr:hypothetical protein [Planctomycetota bacterium]